MGAIAGLVEVLERKGVLTKQEVRKIINLSAPKCRRIAGSLASVLEVMRLSCRSVKYKPEYSLFLWGG